MKKNYSSPEVYVFEVDELLILSTSEVIEEGWEDDPAAPSIDGIDNDDMLMNEE